MASSAFTPGSGLTPTGLTPGEWSAVSEQLLAEDYAVRPSGDGAGFRAVNPAQALGFRFADAGLGLGPIPARDPAREVIALPSAAQSAGDIVDSKLAPVPSNATVHMSTLAIGRSAAMRALPPVAPQAAGNRVEYRHPGVTEWYVNRAQGLEHGYTLDARPEGESGEVRIDVQLGADLSLTQATDSEDLLFRHAGSGRTLRYHKLLVEDARGARLSARLVALEPNQFQIAFDDSGAAYPVTVDPPLVSEDDKIISEGDGATNLNFAYSVAVDGDTLLVGRIGDGIGAAYVFVRSGSTWMRQAKLTPPSEMGTVGFASGFGFSVALSGDTAVVGEFAGGGGTTGVVRVFVRSGEAWTLQATLSDSENRRILSLTQVAISGDTILSNGTPGNRGDERAVNVFVRSGTTWTSQALLSMDPVPSGTFSGPVAISGDTALIGAPDSPDGGAAYVYQRSGTTWTRQAKLLPTTPNARMGFAVALAGNLAVVGEPNETGGAGFSTGATYVFERVGESWLLLNKLSPPDAGSVIQPQFGRSVGVSGNSIVVGQRGSAHVFLRSGSTVTPQARLAGQGDGIVSDFGFSVAIAGSTIVAGAANEDAEVNTRQGYAYVFSRTGTTWMQQARLTAADDATNDNFGWSVALDRDTLVVGARQDSGSVPFAGSAQVFVRSGAEWVPQSRLLSSTPGNGGAFGWSVALDGDTTLVSALQERQDNSSTGAAYVFVRSGTSWIEQTKFTAADGDRFTRFGQGVAIEGDTVVVAATQSRALDNGTTDFIAVAYVFQRSGNVWVQRAKLLPPAGAESTGGNPTVSLSGNTVLIGNEGNRGEAYVFVRSGGDWTFQNTLLPAVRVTNGFFGTSVSLDGDTALICARGNGGGVGAAYVFVRSGTIWTEQAVLEEPDGRGQGFGEFGASVDLFGDMAIIGEPRGTGMDPAEFAEGKAHLFVRSGTTWSLSSTFTASDARSNDSLGKAVAISGNTVVVGADQDTNSSGRNAGAVYVYRLADTLDFGDAPAPYPTLLANDGARHTVGSLSLGLAVDTDPDGRPNSGATGDDIAGTDDEDGVSFPGGLDPGSPATLQAFVTGAPALLDA
ncbi:MAG: hypothetical protein ACT4QA_18585 [Panacagrimonas sp.]